MVLTDENKSSLLEESLATQLEKAVEQPSKSVVSDLPSPLEEGPITVASAPEISAGVMDFLNDTTGKSSIQKTEIENYNTPFLYAVIGIIGSVIVALGGAMFIWYFSAKSLPNVIAPNEYVQSTSDLYDQYGQMLGLFNLQQYESLDLTQEGKNKAKNLISAERLNYPQKKDLLQKLLSSFGQQTIDLKNEIKTTTDQLNKDGFFPEELVGILKENNAVGSIQRSLLSLEIVKFSSAMKVFSLMDVFLSSISNELAIPKTLIKEKLDQLLTRGENDVKNYLNYCYNNPYEPANCSVIWDFDTYYRLNKQDESFDSSFFKTIMDHIDRKLENAQLPSFAITFNDFDSKNNNISFSVEVNTLKEDEYALIKEGIKNPHVFIVSELIKLLKQSTFIVGKAIDIKEMQVEEKEEEIWSAVYKYHSSNKSFTLPIQKKTQREIFDYVESYKKNLGLSPEKAESTGGSLLDSLVDVATGTIGVVGAFINPAGEGTWTLLSPQE